MTKIPYLHGFVSEEAYQMAKIAERDKAESPRARAERYEHEIFKGLCNCGTCRGLKHAKRQGKK